MCRTYVGISLQDNDSVAKKMRAIAMQYMINGKEKGNTDGYFHAVHELDGSVKTSRTMSFLETLKFIYGNEPRHVFHGHARASSAGGVSDEYIHGWKFHDYTCSHNGTIWIDDKYEQCSNDSLSLFRLIDTVYDEDINKFVANIKATIKASVSAGSGVFFMVSPKYTIAFSINKDMYLHHMDNEVVVLNSQDDIHNFVHDEYRIDFELNKQPEPMKLGLLDLTPESKEKRSIRYDMKVNTKKTYGTKLEDVIIVLDNSNGEVIIKEDLPRGVSHYKSKVASTSSYNSYQAGVDASKKGVQITVLDGETGDGEMDLDAAVGKYFNAKEELQKEFDAERQGTEEEANTVKNPNELTLTELRKQFDGAETNDDNQFPGCF